MPDQDSRDPSTWVRRREDPTILEVRREVSELRKLYPMATFVGSAIVVIFSAGMGFAIWEANKVTRAQFEAEQTERRSDQLETAKSIAELKGRVDTLIIQLGKGKK